MDITRRDLAVLGGTVAFSERLATAAMSQDPAPPAGMAARAAAGSKIDPMTLVDAELRPAAEQMRAMAGRMPSVSADMLPAIRARFVAPPEFSDDVPVQEVTIPALSRSAPTTIYVVNAKTGASRPAILEVHGGGMIMGTAKSGVPALQRRAKHLDCAIVTVEYALAPEARWQVSVAQNYAGLQWLYDNAAKLGVDPARIAVAGGSAGGGHAALLALRARDQGLPLCFQLLSSPMLDDRTGSSRDPAAHIGTFSWSRELNRFGWRSFLGQEPGTASVPVEAVPARNADLAGLPPTFISVGSIDLFVDESIAYANRLIDAGVCTQLFVSPGSFHGSEGMMPNAVVSREVQRVTDSALRHALGVPD